MKRKLLIGGAAAGVLLVLAAVVVLYTNLGLRAAIKLAGGLAPGSIQVGAVSGRLVGPLQLEKVHFESPELILTAARLRVDWRLRELFAGSLHVTDLNADQLEVRLLPRAAPSTPAKTTLPAVTSDWGMRLDQGRIEGLRVLPQAGSPIVVQSIDWAGELAAGAVDARIAASDSRGSLSVTAKIDTRRSYRHKLSLLFDPQGPAEEVRLESQGDLESLAILVEADEWDARLSAKIADPLGDPRWTADGTAGFPGIEGFTASGSGNLSQANLTVDLQAGVYRIDGESIQLEWTGEVLRIGDSVLRIPGIAQQIQLRGIVTPGADPRFDINLEAIADTAGPPLEEYLEAARATVDVAGTLASARLNGSAQVTTRQGVLELGFEATGDIDGLDPLQVNVSHAEGVLGLLGAVSWNDGVRWDLDVNGAGLDPALLWPDWQAGLNVIGQTSGSVREGKIHATVDLDDIGGTFRGNPISGKAAGRLSVAGLESFDVNLLIADNSIAATGQWALQRSAEVEAHIVDLGQVLPSASGALDTRLTLAEGPQGLALDASGSGKDLFWNELRVAEMRFAATGPAILDALQSAELHATGLNYSGSDIAALDLAAQGAWAELGVSALIGVPDLGEVELAAVIDVKRQARSGRIEQLDWKSPQFGAWTLREPAEYAVRDAGLALSLCLDRHPGLVCATASGGDQGQRWNLRMQGLPAELAQVPLAIALDRPLRLAGEVSGSVEALVSGGAVSGLEGEFETQSLALSLDFGEGWQALPLGAIQATVSGDGGRLQASANAESEIFSATLELSVSGLLAASTATLQGDLQAEFPDLAAIAKFFKIPVELSGKGQAILRVGGAIDQPDIGGRVNLSEIVFEAAEYGSRWRNGRLEASFEGGHRILISGAIDAEKGTVQIEGEADYVTREGRVRLTGDTVQVAHTPSLLLEISPDLEFTAGASGYGLRGNLVVVTAKIEEFETAQSVSVSPDVVVVDGLVEKPGDEPLPLISDIRVRFENPAELSAYGLNAQLSGDLHVVDTPGKAVLATGELRVGGSYQAYGQDLTIEEGRLIYAQTPLDNPSIRLDAYREVGEVRAGVRVSGRVAEPQLTLYSTPTMSDQEVLSYLILGRASAGGGDFDGSATVANAALQMGLSQGNNVVSQVGSKLGFDQLSIDVDDEFGGAAVSIGRYLSPRLYLSYSAGLVQAIDLLRFEYRLGKKWSIQSEIGVQTRATIGYELETGRPKTAGEG